MQLSKRRGVTTRGDIEYEYEYEYEYCNPYDGTVATSTRVQYEYQWRLPAVAYIGDSRRYVSTFPRETLTDRKSAR